LPQTEGNARSARGKKHFQLQPFIFTEKQPSAAICPLVVLLISPFTYKELCFVFIITIIFAQVNGDLLFRTIL